MKLIVDRSMIKIVPENVPDRVYLEEVLQIREKGSVAVEVRVVSNASGTVSYIALVHKDSQYPCS